MAKECGAVNDRGASSVTIAGATWTGISTPFARRPVCYDDTHCGGSQMVGMGDLKKAEQSHYAAWQAFVQQTCSDALTLAVNQANCSGFAKTVAGKLGIALGNTGNGQANDIYDEVTKPGGSWILLGVGADGAKLAPYYAKQGYLVLAVWKDRTGSNGHIAIVTDFRELTSKTSAITDRNVAASWGVLDRADLSQNNGPIRASFGPGKRDDVTYVAHSIMKYPQSSVAGKP